MKLYLHICLLLLCHAATAQDGPVFPAPGTYIEKEMNGVRGRIVSLSADEWYGETEGIAESLTVRQQEPADTAAMNTVRDTRTINRMLPEGARIITGVNVNGVEYIEAFVAANGMKIIPDYYNNSAPVYFPDEAMLGFICNYDNISLMVDVLTGEDVWFSTDVTASPGGNLRVVRKYFPLDMLRHVLEIFDPASNDYRQVGMLHAFTLYGDYGCVEFTDGYFWIGDSLYVNNDNGYYKLVLEPGRLPGGPPAAKSAPVFNTPSPVLTDMDVRDPLSINYGMTDRKVTVNGDEYRFRRIPRPDFHHLKEYYIPRQLRPRIAVDGLDNIRAALPEYTFLTYLKDDAIAEVRHGDRFRMVLPDEQEGEYKYYPEEHILTFLGGHSSDQAIDFRTGERMYYNPAVTIYSPDMSFRLTGLHDGQESYNFRLQRLDSATGNYADMAYLSDILSVSRGTAHDWYWPDNFFWIGETLYFRWVEGEENCCSITMAPR